MNNMSPTPATHLEKIDRGLSGVFNTVPMPRPGAPVTIIDSADSDQTNSAMIAADTAFVRANLYSIIEQGQDALQYAVDLAKQSDSPKMFESLATLIKTIGDVNMQILESHEKKQKLTGKVAPTESVVNNSIVFSGTTAQLNEMLKAALTTPVIS